MKKLLCALLTAALLLSLAACGGKTQAPSGTQPAGNAAQPALPAGSGWEAADEDEPFGQYRSVDELLAILNGEAPNEEARMPAPEERASVALAEADEGGEEAESAAAYAGGGNTVTFSDSDWEEPSVEFAEFDAAEEGGAEAGSEEPGGAQADAGSPGGGDWSVSSYTAGLPQPPGQLGMAFEEDGTFTAMATLSNESDYSAYIQAVQNAGFDRDVQEEDFSGMDMRSFSASHADGRNLILTLTGGSLIVEIGR